jgi:hypothetical protein
MSFIRGRTIKDLFTVTVLPLSDVVHQGKDNPDERHQKGGGQ